MGKRGKLQATIKQIGVRRQIKVASLHLAIADGGHQERFLHFGIVQLQSHGCGRTTNGCQDGTHSVSRLPGLKFSRKGFAFVCIVIGHAVESHPDRIYCPTTCIAMNLHEI